MTAPPPDPLSSNRRSSAFERQIRRVLAETIPAGPVVVAASGGADSTATLIAVARALGPESVTAAHFDHRLRHPSEAAQDFEAVRALAARLGVLLSVGRPSRRPSDGSEASARTARYRWLARACNGAGAAFCLTGHTLDDQAETVLLRLARGAGALGAAGMRPVAPWPVPAARGAASLHVVRPLLGVTRADVEGYLDALGVTASPDTTNEMLDYARNRVRHELMPALREVNARATEHLAEFAATQRADDEVLTALALEWLQEHAREARGEVLLDRRRLRALPIALASRVIREAAGGLGVRLEGAHVRAVLESLEKSGRSVDLPLAHSLTSGSLLELRSQPSPTQGRD